MKLRDYIRDGHRPAALQPFTFNRIGPADESGYVDEVTIDVVSSQPKWVVSGDTQPLRLVLAGGAGATRLRLTAARPATVIRTLSLESLKAIVARP